MHTLVRSTLVAGLTGTLMVGAAWAGVGISPIPVPSAPETVRAALPKAATGDGPAAAATTAVSPASLGAGQLLVGAAKASMLPRPADMAKRFPGARWETDPVKCNVEDPAYFQDLPAAAANAPDGIASTGSPWPENPDCIYMGGFGIGPANPVKAFDPTYGLWVRSLAISDGRTPFVMTGEPGPGVAGRANLA